MSYLLNHIENNRSEDDEDDHINRLFPKCKPRASSLSLSPSLQHVSPASNSASDLCLNSSNYFPSHNNSNHHQKSNNSNLLRTEAIGRNGPGYSSNSNVSSNKFQKSGESHQHNNSTWGVENFSLLSPSVENRQHRPHRCENNNAERPSDTGLLWSHNNSLETLTRPGGVPTIDRFHQQQSNRPSSTRHKKCENNHQAKLVNKDHKSDRGRVESSNTLENQSSKSSLFFAPAASKLEPEIKDNQSRAALEADFPSATVISQGQEHTPSYVQSNSDKSVVLKPLKSLEKMEHHPMEDNFDNGIGSGCSRSSGESTHSTTSDFMENLVSPVTSSRSRVASGISAAGSKGHPCSSVVTPSIGGLRDSRIEIAGGREIYSQNRIRATRRHRGSSSHSSQPANEIIGDMMPCSHPSSKLRKKSVHSHATYQHPHHHCCHSTAPCCGEIVHPPPHGSLVWEPNHGCRRNSGEILPARPQFMSHSHSFGGPGPCVKCTGTISPCSCCGHHGFDYTAAKAAIEVEQGARVCRSIPPTFHHESSSPTSPMTVRETVFASEVRSVDKYVRGVGAEKAGGSLVQQHELGSPCHVIEPVIYESREGDGEVVFDDIGHGQWRERQGGDSGGYEAGDERDTSDSIGLKKRQMQSASSSSSVSKDKTETPVSALTHAGKCRRPMGLGCDKTGPSGNSPCTSNRDGNTTPSGYESDECSASANTSIHLKPSPNFGSKNLIGSIPIAEYEGSPKRYGLKQTSHPVTTHFDLIDVDMTGELEAENDQVINDSNARTSLDQSVTAGTSSSSSSLDNTNTNVSSNSSSRTNNRVSPRALSPSQAVSAFSARFPGFPQRVNAATSHENTGNTRPFQPCPLIDYTTEANHLTGTNHELLASVNHDSKLQDISSNPKTSEKKETSLTTVQQAMSNGCGPSTSTLATTTTFPRGSSTEQLVQLDSSSPCPLPSESHTKDASNYPSSYSQSSLLEDENFLLESPQMSRPSVSDPRNQDFLYEFSETRKVLEEFFSVGPSGSGQGSSGAFDELDYMLRRQAGNSYVGQRLAGDLVGNPVAEDSPKKPPRRGVLYLGESDGDGSNEKGSPKLISFQEISLPPLSSPNSRGSHQSCSTRSPRSRVKTHSRPHSQSPPPHDPTRDINDNDIDAETASTNTETDLGETQVGHKVGRRKFALSPETTDCDSNELESELSLDYDGALHSSCRVGRRARAVMAVEDGLSSGNESENEEIIEVDVGFREEGCYLMGSKINQTSAPVKRQGDLPNDANLLSCEENKENMHAAESSPAGWPNHENNIEDIGEAGKAGDYIGLSADPNPTLVLMKKQISEIEKEIELRASMQKSQGLGLDTESINDNGMVDSDHSSPTVVNAGSSGGQGKQESICGRNGEQPYSQKEMDPNWESAGKQQQDSVSGNHDPDLEALDPMRPTPPPSPAPGSGVRQQQNSHYQRRLGPGTWKPELESDRSPSIHTASSPSCTDNGHHPTASSSHSGLIQSTSSPSTANVAAAIKDIKDAIQRTKPLTQTQQRQNSLALSASASFAHSRSEPPEPLSHHSPPDSQERVPLICDSSSPVWVPRNARSTRNRDARGDPRAKDPLLKKQRYDETPDDDADTDQETDRLLGQTRTEDDCGFYDEKEWKKPKSRSLLPALNKGVAFVKSATSVPSHQPPVLSSSASISGGNNSISASNSFNPTPVNNSFQNSHNASSSSHGSQNLGHPLSPSNSFDEAQPYLPSSSADSSITKLKKEKDGVKKKRSKEDFLKNPSVLIEGVLFRAKYLGSTQLTCEGQPTKATRMMQAEEAVSRIKADNGSDGKKELPQGSPSSSSASMKPHSEPESQENPHPKSSKENELDASSAACQLSPYSKDGNGEGGEGEDLLYRGEDEESYGESDVDEDLFLKSRTCMGSLGESKGMRLPIEDIHGSSNALHDNHVHPLSAHNRRQSLGNGDICVPQPGFLNLSPPCGSALPGTMFRLRFIGSLEVEEEAGIGKRRRKRPKKIMVEEAVMKMKSMAPEGEAQPSTEVDLFISTEKIMVLNTDLKEIMMDHALRSISYIADIGDLVVLMARRRPVPTDPIDDSKPPRPPKMICHVFESDEAQYIAQSIGQAFQVAYMEFLKANGIEDSSFVREMDYQEVLNSQEIFGDELQMFAKKELQKEVVVPKTKGEILGVVIVESGWGSMLPTVVIANLAPAGAAARCGQLNIGDQIIAINGVSLVGLPLSTCQNYIKNTKNQTVVKLTVVPCPPVVEVKIKRPDTKYQLGFSVQNGVICSLLRGGIAERGGVRVGHRIIEINSQSVVAVPHEKIVNLLATSVGEINMKTMPTSMFRLLTGQETPLYI